MKDFRKKEAITLVKNGCSCLLATLPLLLFSASNAIAAPQIVTRQYSCNAGGFKGTIQVDFLQPYPGRASYIYDILYKIDKGRNSGGNKANVEWGDGGTLPTRVFTTSAGIQNNRFHYLGGNYSRGSGGTSTRFIFDKRGNDPRCTVQIKF